MLHTRWNKDARIKIISAKARDSMIISTEAGDGIIISCDEPEIGFLAKDGSCK
jgi:hypothetical protein